MNIDQTFIDSIRAMINLPDFLEMERRRNIGELESELAKVKIERVKLLKQLRRLQNVN